MKLLRYGQSRVCKRKTTRTDIMSTTVINLTNFFALLGIRTQTDHLQADTRCFCVSFI